MALDLINISTQALTPLLDAYTYITGIAMFLLMHPSANHVLRNTWTMFASGCMNILPKQMQVGLCTIKSNLQLLKPSYYCVWYICCFYWLQERVMGIVISYHSTSHIRRILSSSLHRIHILLIGLQQLMGHIINTLLIHHIALQPIMSELCMCSLWQLIL